MKTGLKEKKGTPADLISPKAIRPVPKNLRFLVAYENSSVCRTIASTLKDMGFSYIEERGETENLYKILKADGISCLICGTKALERNSQELFKTIRSDEDLNHLILVVVDGNPQKDKVLETPFADADVCISVPFSIRDFEKKIRKILAAKFSGNQAA